MMFIELKNGNYLNSSEIVRTSHIEHSENERSWTDWFVIDRQGDSWPVSETQINRMAINGTLVPSRPGDTAVVVTLFEEDGTVQYLIEDSPIVGWSVTGSDETLCGQPVLLDNRSCNEYVGVLLADGRVVVPFDGIYENRKAFAEEQIDLARILRSAVPQGNSALGRKE